MNMAVGHLTPPKGAIKMRILWKAIPNRRGRRVIIRRVGLFLESGNAVAVVETVLIMSLIAGLAILAMATLHGGSLVRDPFAELAATQTHSRVDVAASQAPHASSTPPTIAAAKPRSKVEHGVLLIATCVTALLLGVVLAGHRRNRRKRNDESEEDDEDIAAAVAEVDHRFAKRHDILRILTRDMAMVMENRLTVGQLMSRVLTTIPGNTHRDKILTTMHSGKIRHLLVCRDGDELQGVISDRDVHQKTGAKARDIMTANPITVSPDTAINPAVTMLIDKHISCLPVVDDGRLVGVLTTTDLMLSLQCALQVLHRLALGVKSERPQVEVEQAEPQLVESVSSTHIDVVYEVLSRRDEDTDKEDRIT